MDDELGSRCRLFLRSETLVASLSGDVRLVNFYFSVEEHIVAPGAVGGGDDAMCDFGFRISAA